MNIDLDQMDVLTRKLTQAKAIVTTLEVNGTDVGKFEIQHREVMGLLWTLGDLIDGANDAASAIRVR